MAAGVKRDLTHSDDRLCGLIRPPRPREDGRRISVAVGKLTPKAMVPLVWISPQRLFPADCPATQLPPSEIGFSVSGKLVL